jgi:hypothetical protein
MNSCKGGCFHPFRTSLTLINKRAWQSDNKAGGSFKIAVQVLK